jgi:ABC transporter substrate binding protein
MDAGFVMSCGASLNDMYRRAPYFVDKILKAAKPADLPVEQLTKFELVINAKTAKALGLTIPPSLLLRADQIIDRWPPTARRCMLGAAQLAQWSGPLARMRSPRPLTASVRHSRRVRSRTAGPDGRGALARNPEVRPTALSVRQTRV